MIDLKVGLEKENKSSFPDPAVEGAFAEFLPWVTPECSFLFQALACRFLPVASQLKLFSFSFQRPLHQQTCENSTL